MLALKPDMRFNKGMEVNVSQNGSNPLLEIIDITPGKLVQADESSHMVGPLEMIIPRGIDITSVTYQNFLLTYQRSSKLLLERYQYLLANEPPISPEHEKWRYQKQDIITRLSELESWFVDIDEPPPIDDGSDKYEEELNVWMDRMTNKLTRHITHYCPAQIIHLIEKPTSYRIKQQRYARLASWKNRYEYYRSQIA